MSRIIAVFNQSGGVGKSTLTMNLGYHLVQHLQRVLLLDMDPQASLTLFMGLEPWNLQRTIYTSLMEDEPLTTHHQHGMDLAPANIQLSGAEIELVLADMRDFRLREVLKPIKQQYDFILIDCPPSLGLLSYVSLVAATEILVPIQTEYKAFSGTGLLLNTVARVKKRANPDLKIAGFIPTLYDSRKTQHKRALQAIQEQMTGLGRVFLPIPDAIALSDAAEDHLPLALYQARHPAVPILEQVVKHLLERPNAV